jgi:pimeloyl-ACP methyl ester carboxylesterase
VHRIASTDDVEIAVYDLGGDGPPLLLSHATGFHGQVWLPMAAILSAGWHCYAFDHRAHGASTPPRSETFAWRGFAADTRAVVDALGIGGAVAIGHSMGGAALLMCELDRPGTFSALALYEPIVFSDERLDPNVERPAALVEGSRRRREVFASREAAYDNYASKPPLDGLMPEALRAYVDYGFVDEPDGRVRLACAREHEARIFEMSHEHGTFDRLGDVQCPVLVMAGVSGGASQFADAVADGIPGARFHRFDDLGHFGPLEDPAQVASVIETFFRGT